MTRFTGKLLFVTGPKTRSPGKGKRRATRIWPAPPSPFETISEREQREIDLATRASLRSEPTPRQAVTAPVNDGAGPSGLVGPAMRYPGGGSRSKDRRRVEKQTIVVGTPYKAPTFRTFRGLVKFFEKKRSVKIFQNDVWKMSGNNKRGKKKKKKKNFVTNKKK